MNSVQLIAKGKENCTGYDPRRLRSAVLLWSQPFDTTDGVSFEAATCNTQLDVVRGNSLIGVRGRRMPKSSRLWMQAFPFGLEQTSSHDVESRPLAWQKNSGRVTFESGVKNALPSFGKLPQSLTKDRIGGQRT
eukprot:3884443-Pleurochrysis_carterae.AAC.3